MPSILNSFPHGFTSKRGTLAYIIRQGRDLGVEVLLGLLGCSESHA